MKTLEDRFWEKVRITTGCWFWTGCRHRGVYGDGYGFVSWKGRLELAHRVSWALAHGSSDRLNFRNIYHRCGVLHCVNPDHLFKGNARFTRFDQWHEKNHPQEAS